MLEAFVSICKHFASFVHEYCLLLKYSDYHLGFFTLPNAHKAEPFSKIDTTGLTREAPRRLKGPRARSQRSHQKKAREYAG